MFNLGFGEIVLLGIIALIFIGPKQLPEVAKTVGRFLNDLKRASEDLTGDFVKSRDAVNRFSDDARRKLQETILQTENDVNKSLRQVEKSVHQEPQTQDTKEISTDKKEEPS